MSKACAVRRARFNGSKALISFHTQYDALTPEPFSIEGDAAIFSLKLERYISGAAPLDYIDAVVLQGQRIVPIPFVRIAGERAIFPASACGFGETFLSALAAPLVQWYRTKAQDPPPTIDILGKDVLLEALVTNEEPGNAIVPGLVLHRQLMRAVEPYRHAIAACANRRVVDLNPGSGYPPHVVRRFACKYTCAPAGEFDALLHERLGYGTAAPDGADIVLAFGLDPSNMARAAEQALSLLVSGGSVFLSAAGEAGRDALAAFGEPRRLGALGGEASETFDDYFVEVTRGAASFPAPDLAPATAPITTSRRLSILMVLRNTAEHGGGDVVQVRETAAALRARGHRVDVTTEPSPTTEGYDVVELSNITAGPITLAQARAVERFPGPVAMMPIFTDHADETMWGMHAGVAPFMISEDTQQLDEWIGRVARREFSVNNIAPPPARSDHYAGATQEQRQMLERVDFLLANALSEVHRIYRYLIPGIPFGIVPSCANPRIYRMQAREQFEARYGLKDFVLTTGRFEPRKNQLLLFEAARRMPDRLFLCIGKNYEAPFGTLVRRYWPKNVVILPHMPETELAGAYAAARVAALPAWDEVVSLSTLNAAACGASLVLTRNSYEHEYIRDDAEYCDPGDVESISAAIDRAWASYDRREDRRRELAGRVVRELNWDRAAELTEEYFLRLLSDNPRGADRLRRYSA